MSNDTTFTPLPWTVEGDAVGADFYIMASDDVVVAEVDENEANARLIAAAPALYEHLQFAVKLLSGMTAFRSSAQVEAMRAALQSVKEG